MLKGQTQSGFRFSINPDIQKDWDFLECIDALNGGDTSLTMVKKTLVLLLGNEGFERLKAHVKKKCNGVANVDVMVAEITEIMGVLNIKKS